MNDVEKILSNISFRLCDEMSSYLYIRYIREVELLISRNYSSGIFRCPVHLSVGQEAIAVGISKFLDRQDKVLSTHRAHAHYLAKDGNLSDMLLEIMGSVKGCCGGRGGSMHLIDKHAGFFGAIPIVGSSLPIASGLGLAEKRYKSGKIVVVFTGDASLETGAFYETLNLIALMEIPLLVVIEDNGYSTFSNKEPRSHLERNTKLLVEGFGVKYFSGNGDTIQEVTSIAKKSIDYVRTTKPAVLELSTFRLLEHCGPNSDDKLGYRSREEIDSYKYRDPLLQALTLLNLTHSSDDIKAVDFQVSNWINQVFDHCVEIVAKELDSFRNKSWL